jgi:hypothetical protein
MTLQTRNKAAQFLENTRGGGREKAKAKRKEIDTRTTTMKSTINP